ncbi:MAG: hypothetical protein LBJ08_08325, partial [Bifidobacteriaceae bacterium]|nr:hypothetical protein [Bifidobacteriaceae bacterium]
MPAPDTAVDQRPNRVVAVAVLLFIALATGLYAVAINSSDVRAARRDQSVARLIGQSEETLIALSGEIASIRAESSPPTAVIDATDAAFAALAEAAEAAAPASAPSEDPAEPVAYLLADPQAALQNARAADARATVVSMDPSQDAMPSYAQLQYGAAAIPDLYADALSDSSLNAYARRFVQVEMPYPQGLDPARDPMATDRIAFAEELTAAADSVLSGATARLIVTAVWSIVAAGGLTATVLFWRKRRRGAAARAQASESSPASAPAPVSTPAPAPVSSEAPRELVGALAGPALLDAADAGPTAQVSAPPPILAEGPASATSTAERQSLWNVPPPGEIPPPPAPPILVQPVQSRLAPGADYGQGYPPMVYVSLPADAYDPAPPTGTDTAGAGVTDVGGGAGLNPVVSLTAGLGPLGEVQPDDFGVGEAGTSGHDSGFGGADAPRDANGGTLAGALPQGAGGRTDGARQPSPDSEARAVPPPEAGRADVDSARVSNPIPGAAPALAPAASITTGAVTLPPEVPSPQPIASFPPSRTARQRRPATPAPARRLSPPVASGSDPSRTMAPPGPSDSPPLTSVPRQAGPQSRPLGAGSAGLPPILTPGRRPAPSLRGRPLGKAGAGSTRLGASGPSIPAFAPGGQSNTGARPGDATDTQLAPLATGRPGQSADSRATGLSAGERVDESTDIRLAPVAGPHASPPDSGDTAMIPPDKGHPFGRERGTLAAAPNARRGVAATGRNGAAARGDRASAPFGATRVEGALTPSGRGATAQGDRAGAPFGATQVQGALTPSGRGATAQGDLAGAPFGATQVQGALTGPGASSDPAPAAQRGDSSGRPRSVRVLPRHPSSPRPSAPNTRDSHLGDSFDTPQGPTPRVAPARAVGPSSAAPQTFTHGDGDGRRGRVGPPSSTDRQAQKDGEMPLETMVGRMERHTEALTALARFGAPNNNAPAQRIDSVVVTAAARAGVAGRIRVQAEALPTVRAPYVDALRHLLVEVLDNAARFSQPDRMIDVSLGSVRDGAILQVTDYGVGMSPEDFAEATRVMAANADPTDTHPQASHMGLAVVARAAAALGAWIRISPVQSHPGTQVAIALPDAIFVTAPNAPVAEVWSAATVHAETGTSEGPRATGPRTPVRTAGGRPKQVATEAGRQDLWADAGSGRSRGRTAGGRPKKVETVGGPDEAETGGREEVGSTERRTAGGKPKRVEGVGPQEGTATVGPDRTES